MSPKSSLHKILLTLLVLTRFGVPPALTAQDKDPFPLIPGWMLTVDSAVYTPDNLWNIIDGAADAYLLYGFVDLHIGEYLGPDSVDVRAELYSHSSAANAFGIYSQERKPEYRFIDVATEGYVEDGVLNFLCGRYYVKLTSHTMGAKGLTALRTAAETFVPFLHQEKGFPPQLALLPHQGKIPRSESYIADSYLGYSFFRGAFVAQYDSGGTTQLFVMECESPVAARAVMEQYMKTVGNRSSEVQDGPYMLSDPNIGTIGILLKGRHLCGVVNCRRENARSRYLESLNNSVR